MKRRLLRTGLAALAALALALSTACVAPGSGSPDAPLPPNPMTPEEFLASCGEGCTLVGFVLDLYDEDMIPVPLMEGYVAEIMTEAWELDPEGGPPRLREIFDADKGVYAPTPYPSDIEVPATILHGIPQGVVHVIVTAIVLIPAGWTFKCKTLQQGSLIPLTEDSTTTAVTPGAEGAMGFPSDAMVHCSWPTSGFDDIT